MSAEAKLTWKVRVSIHHTWERVDGTKNQNQTVSLFTLLSADVPVQHGPLFFFIKLHVQKNMLF